MRHPELLVPASSLEVLKIAVIFGADAVYIGGEAFGLRAKAKNFSMEDMKEGGARCFGCYALRLEETAKLAKEGKFDYFTTTLTISPLKNAEKLNEIGNKLADKYGVAYLPSDFKKKNGYKRSIELSKEYGLYRQDYCGCEFSQRYRIKNEERGN